MQVTILLRSARQPNDNRRDRTRFWRTLVGCGQLKTKNLPCKKRQMSTSQPAPPSATLSETSPAGGLPRALVVAGIAALWGGLFYGALQISNMKLGYWKFMCGPWGCLPETAPLVSVHAMWLTFLFGAIWLARLSIPILQSAKLWFVLAGVTLLGLSIYLGVDLARNWSPRYGPAEICKRSIYATMI